MKLTVFESDRGVNFVDFVKHSLVANLILRDEADP